VSEAFYHCRHKQAGPVHINVPLAEPLYGKTVHPEEKQRQIKQITSCSSISNKAISSLSEEWNHHDRILIVAGMQQPNPQLQEVINQLSEMEQLVVLTEATSNINGEQIISGIDKVVSTITEEEVHFFKPSLLITFDGAVVSKMIKTFLRNYQAKQHWHISLANHHLDTYQQLTTSIEAEPVELFKQLLPHINSVKSRFKTTWINRDLRSDKHHDEFLSKDGWNDLKAFSHIAKCLPDNWQVQWGNSSAIRYAQLFKEFYNQNAYCNRGTSGIDGSVSTAVGASYISKQPTLLVVGDLSFMYDSNGLWNNYLKPDLRIIVINNGGGGIFRFIPGPSDSEELETYFEASHQLNVRPLAEMYGIQYLSANDEESMNESLPQLFAHSERPIILEVKTPAKENAGVLKSYFKRLKEEL
jgi:2-succinyl-5-enolpyruvyl-6-hydroxy-3-cyclohexene-1-carboxylate synthase